MTALPKIITVLLNTYGAIVRLLPTIYYQLPVVMISVNDKCPTESYNCPY